MSENKNARAMKRICTLILLAGVFAGCVKDDTAGVKRYTGTPVVITAAMDGTRTSLGDDSRTVTWSKGDRIAVYSQLEAEGTSAVAMNGGNQMEFTLDEGSAGLTHGRFNGSLVFAEDESIYTNPTYTLHAYYPYSAANDKNKKWAVAGTLPAMQSCDMKGVYDLSACDFLVGEAKGVLSSDSEFGIAFKRVFAMMQFQITNATAETFSVRQVTMSAAGKALAGDFTIQVHRNLNVVEGSLGEGQDGRPKFKTPSESVGVTVDQGLLTVGEQGTARLLFNRWEELTNTDLTVTVTTNKGTYTRVLKTGDRDFSLKDNYILPIHIDALEPLGDVEVDNYVEDGSMTLVSSDDATLPTSGGTFCIEGNVTVKSNLSIRGNFTVIGRHTINGVPQDAINICFANNHASAKDKTLTFRNIIVRPVATSSSNRYIVRSNNAKADMQSVVFENCILEYPEGVTQDPDHFVLLMHNSGYVIKNLTIKNCIIRNMPNGLITYAGASADAQSRIEQIELVNNTFYTDEATASAYMSFCGGNIVLRNNTFYNYSSKADGALISVAAGNVECTKNIFHAPTPSVLFDNQPATETDNCLFNFSVLAGGEAGATDPSFVNPTADFTPQNPEVIAAGQGDQRWL